ncbi:dihydrofolate reductase family protein [Enemella evansiae]|uniref:dihydrofolate reductase family protein n=1 Tax=Enemella evansiae TaxID=2016499 RepID=UPI00106170FB|nr:dihydrofolate reductase family protein [Enemella evansiae]TDO85394.1 dihydrofolate reductase [Enemella evansiae]
MELTVNVFTTLDGVMQAPGAPEEDTAGGFRHGGWLGPYADQGMGEIVERWFADADAVLLGRRTYQAMAGYWPRVDDDGSTTWRVLNTGPKYVVSTTLAAAADWANSTVIGTDILARVSELKRASGRELQVHGSWRLIQTLHEAGLVDAYRLLVFPTSVGGLGKRVFADGSTPTGFTVSEVQVTESGIVAMTLRPEEFRQAGVAVVDGKDSVVELAQPV